SCTWRGSCSLWCSNRWDTAASAWGVDRSHLRQKAGGVIVCPRSGERGYKRLVRLVGGGFARDLRQRVHRGLLFRFFLVAAPGGGVVVAADDGGDLEALAVIGALLVQELVEGRLIELALGHLLKVRLVVARVSALGDFFDLRPHVLEDEWLDRL